MAVSQFTSSVNRLQPPGVALGLDDLRVALDELTASALPLLSTLREYRRNCRPGYPPEPLFRAFAASFLLNLPHTNALIRTLQTDHALRYLCGFGDGLPHRSTFNRFIQRLSRHADLVEDVSVGLAGRLKEMLPDLGEEVAVDSTAVRTHSNPNRKVVSDPAARWGVKHSVKAKEGGTEYFFGYKVHAVADVKYGIPLAQVVTAGNRNDSPMLAPVMEKAEASYNWWGPQVAIGDRGYDSNANHHWLDDRGITPVIHIRRPSHTKFYDGIYGADGTPTCLGQVPMKYVETDPATGHHRYVCPEGGCHLKGTRKAVLYCDSEVWEDPSTNIRLFGKIRRNSRE